VKRQFKCPERHHLDRRVGQLLATTPKTKTLLSTRQVADWLGVSDQWLEVGRVKGYGPPFERLGPRLIKYERSAVIKWLKQRQQAMG